MRRALLPIALTLLVASASPARARTPIVISDAGLSRTQITAPLGGQIAWSNELARDVSLVSAPLPYWTVDVASGTTASATMTLAGNWDYSLADDSSVTGKVRVPPQVSDTTLQVGQWFTFSGASELLAPGYEWDLLRRKIGTGYLGTIAGGIRSASIPLRFHQAGEFVFTIRTFGYNPSVGYETYTPLSPRITVTVTA
jgi:hypothetical protein